MSYYKIVCTCGATANLIRGIPTKDSKPECYWVECLDCGLIGDPAVTIPEARLFWDAGMRKQKPKEISK